MGSSVAYHLLAAEPTLKLAVVERIQLMPEPLLLSPWVE